MAKRRGKRKGGQALKINLKKFASTTQLLRGWVFPQYEALQRAPFRELITEQGLHTGLPVLMTTSFENDLRKNHKAGQSCSTVH